MTCDVISGMVNCANIDWFFPWPEQALYAVASVFISPDVSLLPFSKHLKVKISFNNTLMPKQLTCSTV